MILGHYMSAECPLGSQSQMDDRSNVGNHSLSGSYTSCCISDVSSQWEGAIFDPP